MSSWRAPDGLSPFDPLPEEVTALELEALRILLPLCESAPDGFVHHEDWHAACEEAGFDVGHRDHLRGEALRRLRVRGLVKHQSRPEPAAKLPPGVRAQSSTWHGVGDWFTAWETACGEVNMSSETPGRRSRTSGLAERCTSHGLGHPATF